MEYAIIAIAVVGGIVLVSFIAYKSYQASLAAKQVKATTGQGTGDLGADAGNLIHDIGAFFGVGA